jgi:hypothetical protein
LSNGKQVFLVSPWPWEFLRHHPRCRSFDTVADAIRALVAMAAGRASARRSPCSIARACGMTRAKAKDEESDERERSSPHPRARSPTRGARKSAWTSRPAGLVDQEISEHPVAEGPADDRCHHRVSQGRAPLSQPKVRKILDTTPLSLTTGIWLAAGAPVVACRVVWVEVNNGSGSTADDIAMLKTRRPQHSRFSLAIVSSPSPK